LPGVVNIAEHAANFVVEIVIDTKEFLAPIRRERGGPVPRIRSVGRKRNLRHQGRRIGLVDRNQIAWEGSPCVRVYRAIAARAKITKIPKLSWRTVGRSTRTSPFS